MAVMTLIEAVNDALDHELGQDDRVLVFGEDVGINGGVFRATQPGKHVRARAVKARRSFPSNTLPIGRAVKRRLRPWVHGSRALWIGSSPRHR